MLPLSEPEPEAFHRPPRGWWLSVATAALAALVVRLTTPGGGPLWRDEALFVFVSRLPSTGELVKFLHEHESHPPLFYLVMRAWGNVAGHGDAALRVLPFALSILLVPLIAWVGARAFGTVAGVVAAWIVAIHPNLAFHAVQLRPYGALMLLAVGSSYALWRLIETRQARSWLAYAASALAMVYLHHWSWLVLAAQGAALVIAAIIDSRRVLISASSVCAAWVAVGIAYLPMLPTLLRHVRHSGHPPEHLGPDDAMARFSDVTVAQLGSRPGVAVLILAFGAVLMRPAERSRIVVNRDLRAYSLLGLIAPLAVAIGFAASTSSNLLVPHALTTLIPFVALAIAAGVGAMIVDRRYAATTLLIVVLMAAMALETRRILKTEKSNAALLAMSIAAKARPTDVVIIAPDIYASSFNYYFRGMQQQIGFPRAGRHGVVYFDDWYDRIADSAALAAAVDSIHAFRRRSLRVWLVSEEILFSDTASLPSRVPPEGSPLAYLTGRIRARELGSLLHRLYGPPDSLLLSTSAIHTFEDLGAVVYAPPDLEGRRPSPKPGQ